MPANPRDTWPKPPAYRIFFAFLGAPTFATALVASVGSYGNDAVPDSFAWNLFAFIIGLLFVTLPLTVVVGVPLFLVLRRHVRPSFWACSLAGAAVLCLPVLLILLSLATTTFPPYATSGYFTFLYGERTGWWWFESAVLFGAAAALGLVAGFVFWLIAAAGLKPEQQGAVVARSGTPPRLEGTETDPVTSEGVLKE